MQLLLKLSTIILRLPMDFGSSIILLLPKSKLVSLERFPMFMGTLMILLFSPYISSRLTKFAIDSGKLVISFILK